MSKTLLIIPPGVRPEASEAYAIEAAQRAAGSLIAVAVLDPAEITRIAATLDSAFMGEQVSDRVVEVLGREQRLRAEEVLDRIGARARAAGISFVPLIEQGDPEEVCARIVRTHQIGFAVLAVERQSWLARFLSRSAKVRIPSLAGCEVKVIEEDAARPTKGGSD
jgi:nucleotide-binding universal stress UspA family protein